MVHSYSLYPQVCSIVGDERYIGRAITDPKFPSGTWEVSVIRNTIIHCQHKLYIFFYIVKFYIFCSA